MRSFCRLGLHVELEAGPGESTLTPYYAGDVQRPEKPVCSHDHVISDIGKVNDDLSTGSA